MTRAITAVCGIEPMRDGEYPPVCIVGGTASRFAGQGEVQRFTVTRIERRDERFGDHTLAWYDVYDGDVVALSLQGRAIAEVHYAYEAAA